MYNIISNLQSWITGQVTVDATGKEESAKPANDKTWKWDEKPIVSSGTQTEPLIEKKEEETNFDKLKKKSKKNKKKKNKKPTGNIHIDYAEVLKSPLEVLKEQREFERAEKNRLNK